MKTSRGREAEAWDSRNLIATRRSALLGSAAAGANTRQMAGMKTSVSIPGRSHQTALDDSLTRLVTPVFAGFSLPATINFLHHDLSRPAMA